MRGDCLTDDRDARTRTEDPFAEAGEQCDEEGKLGADEGTGAVLHLDEARGQGVVRRDGDDRERIVLAAGRPEAQERRVGPEKVGPRSSFRPK